MVPVVLTLAGCATSPGNPIEIPSASARIVGRQELARKFGTDFLKNPYLEPVTLFRGKLEEFVVIEVSLSLPTARNVVIRADVRSKDGAILAEQKDLSYMYTFTQAIISADDRDEIIRTDKLTRSYLPAASISGKAGYTKYLVVLMGKNPIPRPSDAIVEVNISGADSVVSVLPLD